MVESDHAEERLARVERILSTQRDAAVKAVTASKVVIVVKTAPPLGSTQRSRRAKRKRPH